MLLISKGIKLLILLIIFLLSKRLSTFCLNIQSDVLYHGPFKHPPVKTIEHLLHNCMHYILYFSLVYWLPKYLWVFPLSSLLAGAGLAGVALGLGAQGFLSDVVNGFSSY